MTGQDANGDARIAFYDAWVPSLKDGSYAITVEQALAVDTARTATDGGDARIDKTPQPQAAQRFVVRGPRFAIDPSEVHRAFPPPAAAGAYDKLLPTVVLNRRALPWERELPTSLPKPESYPWMALLVLAEDELLTPAGDAAPGVTGAVSLPVGEALAAPAGTLAPGIEPAADEDPKQIHCQVIELAAETFERVTPVLGDARLLAHVRQASTAHKEPNAAVREGWVSAVVANRFPLPPAPGGEPRRNVAHLVSLEGLTEQLSGDKPTLPDDYKRVRLISLYSWAFSCLADPQVDFRTLMLNLISPASERGTGYLLRIPPPRWSPTAPPDPWMATAWQRLHEGYAPLAYGTHSGERTFAWYRGPLSPVPVWPFFEDTHAAGSATRGPPLTAADTMVYEPSTGVFDQSYAVAWQTGRSLALASIPFATTLLQMRRDAHALVDLVHERGRSPAPEIAQRFAAALATGIDDPEQAAGELRSLAAADPGRHALASFLGSDAGAELARGLARDPDTRPAVPATPAPAAPPLVHASQAQIAALLEQPAVVQLVQPAPDAATVKQIVDWLGRKVRLYDIPFDDLVPDEQMLPVESIRFFYVDPNWIDALIDGALSVGIQSSRDSALHGVARDALRAAVADAHEQPVAGFLLRSAVVSGWPGLEVRAYPAGEGAAPMTPIRLDRVAPTTMLALYADVPVRVELDEPAEGLVFGPDDAGFTIRYLPGMSKAVPGNIGAAVDPPIYLAPPEIAATRRDDPAGHGALRIGGSDGLAAALEHKTDGDLALTSASLAVTLVRAPEQMVFEPKASA